MATGSIYLKFERFQVLQEWKDGQMQEELKEMRKLVGELHVVSSARSSPPPPLRVRRLSSSP